MAALSELHRVLRPDGALVLSRQHPTGDWLRHGGSHFDALDHRGDAEQGLEAAVLAGAAGERTRKAIFAAGSSSSGS